MKSSATPCSPSLRLTIAGICLLTSLICGKAVAQANDGVDDYFKLYYRQQAASGQYQQPLDFLRTAAMAHASAESLLKAGPTRWIMVDRDNGYLRIDTVSDSSGTDEILTMAAYRKADGSLLLVVGGSDCDDECEFSDEFFITSADHLQPVPRDAVIPAIQPSQFIKPGNRIPQKLAAEAPRVNYLPARVRTALALAPWYGYETEETMNHATRALIRTLVLDWDAKQGRFVRPRDGGARIQVTLPRPTPASGAAPPRTGPSPPG